MLTPVGDDVENSSGKDPINPITSLYASISIGRAENPQCDYPISGTSEQRTHGDGNVVLCREVARCPFI